MFLHWSIRYLDKSVKEFKTRHLYVDTDLIEPAIGAAIELIAESKSGSSNRGILNFRRHFAEVDAESLTELGKNATQYSGFCLPDYFEDELGNEISIHEIGKIITGDPTAQFFPSGFRKHDAEYCLSTPKPLPVAEVTLTQDEVRILGYFVRDHRELSESALMKERPGSLLYNGTGPVSINNGTGPIIKTAVTDAEIHSFAICFRRLYMAGEPANFSNAVAVFTKALGDHPIGKWVEGTWKEFETALGNSEFWPHVPSGQTTFTTKNLIDAFLYTQIAHQPLGKNGRRQKEYEDYLNQLQGKKALLTWLFLTEIWKVSLILTSAGKVIANWFRRYCDHHGISTDVIPSMKDEHPGIGSQEKESDRWARIFEQKKRRLAETIWKRNGSAPAGPEQFLDAAEKELRKQFEHTGERGAE